MGTPERAGLTAPERALLLEGEPINYDLVQHLDHGWIYSSVTAFGMARIVDPEWPEEEIWDSAYHVDPATPLAELTRMGCAWYFCSVAGDVAEVLSKLPFPLPEVIYHRRRQGENIQLKRFPYHRFAARFQ